MRALLKSSKLTLQVPSAAKSDLPISNESTAKWRVFTDSARESWKKVGASFARMSVCLMERMFTASFDQAKVCVHCKKERVGGQRDDKAIHHYLPTLILGNACLQD